MAVASNKKTGERACGCDGDGSSDGAVACRRRDSRHCDRPDVDRLMLAIRICADVVATERAVALPVAARMDS